MECRRYGTRSITLHVHMRLHDEVYAFDEVSDQHLVVYLLLEALVAPLDDFLVLPDFALGVLSPPRLFLLC